MDTKREIRKKILQERDLLTYNEVMGKSQAIFNRLCSLPQYKRAKTVMAYVSYRNEVSTPGFIAKVVEDGKRIVLPKVSASVLYIYEIHDIEKDIMPGFKGIPEPLGEPESRVDPAEIDLAVIPGVVFDLKKYRIGYGGGFYDRFIPSLRRDCLKIGVAFQIQMVSKIQGESFDVPVDMVITENMII
jgi:5-formyltetrahydrofolate cyclo-ligase